MKITNDYKRAMRIGDIFWRDYCVECNELEEWCVLEECSEMCRRVIEYMDEYHVDEHSAMNVIIPLMLNGDIIGEDHMCDDICKGFLAGAVFGKPTRENLKKVRMDEKLWESYF